MICCENIVKKIYNTKLAHIYNISVFFFNLSVYINIYHFPGKWKGFLSVNLDYNPKKKGGIFSKSGWMSIFFQKDC